MSNRIEKEDQVVVTDRDDYFARMIAPGAAFLVVLLIWTGIRMLWKEVDDRRIWILAASIMSLILFIVVPHVMKAKVVPRLVKAIATLLLFLPFILGCYLVAYEGVWRLRFLDDGFSFGLVVAAFIYIVGGIGVVNSTYNISEFGRAMSTGIVRFEEKAKFESVDLTSE